MEGQVYVEVDGKGTEAAPAEQGANVKQRAKAEQKTTRAGQKTTTAEKMDPKIPTVEKTTARVELKTTTPEQI